MAIRRSATLLFFGRLPSAHRRQAASWARIYLAIGTALALAMICTLGVLLGRLAHATDEGARAGLHDALVYTGVVGLACLATLAASVWAIQHMLAGRGKTVGELLADGRTLGTAQSVPVGTLAAEHGMLEEGA